MGNHPSQQPLVTEVAVSYLSEKGHRRISTSPFIKAFTTAPKSNLHSRGHGTSSGTWFEASTGPHVSQHRPRRLPQSNRQHLPKDAEAVQKVVTQTTRQPGANGKTYVVSTTTYYVNKSPADSVKGTNSSPTNADNSVTSSNTSANSSNTPAEIISTKQITHVNGRQYILAPGMPYRTPCDDDESDRLIITHFLLKYAYHGNFVAPIKNMLEKDTSRLPSQSRPQVLDIGCGPGSWVLEMASDFPNTDFHGVDISPMFPSAIRPPNSYFCEQNILNGLTCPDDTFDYIHIRLMLSYLTKDQTTKLFEEVYRVLKPGGYIELCDVEYSVQRPGPVTAQVINQQLYSVFDNTYNIKLDLVHQAASLLMTQFIDVKHSSMTLPLGWGDQIGEVHGQSFDAFLWSIDPKIREAVVTTSASQQEQGLTESVIAEIMAECAKYQSHLNWTVCTAMKPINHLDDFPISPSHPQTPSYPAASSINASFQNASWESIRQFADGFIDE